MWAAIVPVLRIGPMRLPSLPSLASFLAMFLGGPAGLISILRPAPAPEVLASSVIAGSKVNLRESARRFASCLQGNDVNLPKFEEAAGCSWYYVVRRIQKL